MMPPALNSRLPCQPGDMKLAVRREELCHRLPQDCPYFSWRLRQLRLPPKDVREGDKLALGLSGPPLGGKPGGVLF